MRSLREAANGHKYCWSPSICPRCPPRSRRWRGKIVLQRRISDPKYEEVLAWEAVVVEYVHEARHLDLEIDAFDVWDENGELVYL